jgi:Ca-activated chloride channel family protein
MIYRNRLLFLSLLMAGFAFGFQGVDAKVSIVPRRLAVPEPPHESTDAHLRVDTSLVVVPAFATTERGASVMGLKRDNFRVFEDGVEQSLSYFASDDAPVSVGLLFDASGSMHSKMQKSVEAVGEFLKTSNREDEFFLIEFNDRPKLTVDFTFDPGNIQERISRTRVFGRTSLYDAVHMALQQMKKAHLSRKALVVFSDGGDNRSRYTFREIKADLLEADVQLYTIGIFDPDVLDGNANKAPIEEKAGPEVLAQLSEESGGMYFPVKNINDLPGISASVGNQLRNQYLLGYSPEDLARDGKYHQFRVDLVPPPGMSKLRIFYRRGYHSPTQ